jgi:hypothetical protein
MPLSASVPDVFPGLTVRSRRSGCLRASAAIHKRTEILYLSVGEHKIELAAVKKERHGTAHNTSL